MILMSCIGEIKISKNWFSLKNKTKIKLKIKNWYIIYKYNKL